jgi:preprotein translocase subunit SecE
MAKSRAQRKAEQRKRREEQLRDRARGKQEQAQRRTQVPESGEVAEVEAVIKTGADVADYGEHVQDSHGSSADGAEATVEGADATDLEAPAPSRADVGAPEEVAPSRRERRKLEKDQARRAKESAARREPQQQEERKRGPISSFFVSVWRELQRVQWPDRDTLVQASAVTVVFVAIAAAYLGALDFVFSRLVQLII